MVLISGKWYVAPLDLNGGVMLPFFIIIFLVMLFKQIKNKNIYWKKLLINILYLIYLWLLLDITLFPIFLFPHNMTPYTFGLGRQVFINLQFNALQDYLPLQVIGNILLLAPLSFFMAVFKQKYTYFWNNLFLMFLCTLSIETAQLIMSFFYLGNRTFDVNDLLLNTTGSILGFIFFKLTDHFFSKEILEVRSN
ncbi:VanZ family protein [Lactobacillus ultunensis]|uniref:VanZ-like protein n=1 Tax=Lactobacillus ultunensis DSM 16047 TaxID=525365 RepID=C2EPA7_9LACO|nr:VanZ family protein [Lactobacillus ultunensis]EEJ71602.1 VanZ-like protein [Lactobacillus ultunensis DSM 16047]KRL82463.1 teicoplanin resistance protein VanZ [Lactobacillus ultunensis DSM 16047]QQP28416.1 VanZ family protein [Lactobacillus ultunensis]